MSRTNNLSKTSLCPRLRSIGFRFTHWFYISCKLERWKKFWNRNLIFLCKNTLVCQVSSLRTLLIKRSSDPYVKLETVCIFFWKNKHYSRQICMFLIWIEDKFIFHLYQLCPRLRNGGIRYVTHSFFIYLPYFTPFKFYIRNLKNPMFNIYGLVFLSLYQTVRQSYFPI